MEPILAAEGRAIHALCSCTEVLLLGDRGIWNGQEARLAPGRVSRVWKILSKLTAGRDLQKANPRLSGLACLENRHAGE
jgi:hypothetical protein